MRSSAVFRSGAGGGLKSTANTAVDLPGRQGWTVQSAGHWLQVSELSSSLLPQVALAAAAAGGVDSAAETRVGAADIASRRQMQRWRMGIGKASFQRNCCDCAWCGAAGSGGSARTARAVDIAGPLTLTARRPLHDRRY